MIRSSPLVRAYPVRRRFRSRYDGFYQDGRETRHRSRFRVLGEYLKNTKAASERDTGVWFEAEYGGSRTLKTYTLGYT